MRRISAAVVQFIKRTDLLLLSACVAASAWGAMLLWGIYFSGYVRERVFWIQVLASAIGLVAGSVLSVINYRTLAKLWKLYLPLTIVPVLLTYAVGIQRASYIDDKAWLLIPYFGVTFQPSELLKLAFILFFALHLERERERIARPAVLLSLCVHAAIPIGMIVLQGDDGTAMVFAAIFCCMIFVAGIRLRFIAVALGAAGVVSPLVWIFILDNDKRARILTVLEPAIDPSGAGWQQGLGLVSIGAGQIWGKGVFAGNHQYVPEIHNDFIFAFVGESTGFVGSALLLVLMGFICLRILHNAFRAKDPLGRYICVGVFAVIAFQTAWSIGMCLSLLPVAGLTLPFFSAGGTSVVLSYLGIGLVLSVFRHSKTGLFDQR